MRTTLAVWMSEGESILLWPMYPNTDEGHQQFIKDLTYALCRPELYDGEPVSESAIASSAEMLEQYMDAPSELQRVEEDELPAGIDTFQFYGEEDEDKFVHLVNKICNWKAVVDGELPAEDVFGDGPVRR